MFCCCLCSRLLQALSPGLILVLQFVMQPVGQAAQMMMLSTAMCRWSLNCLAE